MSDLETAAIPSLIAVLQAAQTAFTTILSGDPATIALRAGPAAQVFLGQVGLQVPALATAEIGAVQTDINTKIGAMISNLQAKLPKS